MKLFLLVAIANVGLLFAASEIETTVNQILEEKQQLLAALAANENRLRSVEKFQGHEEQIESLKNEVATLKMQAKDAAINGQYVIAGKMTARYSELEQKIDSLKSEAEAHGRRLYVQKGKGVTADFKGLRIKHDKAILSMGKEEDVKFFKSGPRRTTLTADLDVRGKLSVDGLDLLEQIETFKTNVTTLASRIPKKDACPFTKGKQAFEKVGSASWTAPKCVKKVTVLVVAGGGGGGGRGGGGGGAGGLLYKQDYPVKPGQTYGIVVGQGGKGGCGSGGSCGRGDQGQNSKFDTLTAIGGGYGGGDRSGSSRPEGGSGGSGGGGYETSCSSHCPGGSGTAGQGTRGGDGVKGPIHDSGGGGGAGESGGHAKDRGNGHGGHGGAGRCFAEFSGYGDGNGCFAGGGGGAVHNPCKSGGAGGKGGGGNAGACCGKNGYPGKDKTGGGGGGGSTCGGGGGAGAKGGSGVVIVMW